MKQGQICFAAAGLLAAATANAAGRSSVVLEYPERYTDLAANPTHSGDTDPALAEALRQAVERMAAVRLRPGQTLNLSIRDVDLAGRMELVGVLEGEWQAEPTQVRNYVAEAPPYIRLQYALIENDQVIGHGDVALREPHYLAGAATAQPDDPLQYEKRMVDRWLTELLGMPRAD